MTPTPSITPTKTLSGIYPVRFRADLPRQIADDYWTGPHAELVKLPVTHDDAEQHEHRHVSADRAPLTSFNPPCKE